MMNARRFDGRAHRHVKIDDVEDCLQGCADDARPAGRADDKLRAVLSQDDRRRHAAERTFVGICSEFASLPIKP